MAAVEHHRYQLEQLADEVAFGDLRLDAAVTLAADLVAEGLGGPATIELASQPSAARLLVHDEVEPLVRSMLAELGVDLPSVVQEPWARVFRIANRIEAGSIAPPAGASALWSLWRACGAEPDDPLVQMLLLQEEWETSVGLDRVAAKAAIKDYASTVARYAAAKIRPED